MIGGLNAFGLRLEPLQAMSDALPFSAYGMEWIIHALAGTAFGLLSSQIGQTAPAEELEIET
ncbi:hypothetical protein SRABI96_04160 [Peribacillus sp. Bi96]|uniref:hypothetical protein n=1 Tax=Peribacillus sp. Bi96 TaxID=2884273 RepID=UPI001D7BC67F|nr:hypothetical protein [Peribacillus sp. Bi96]CAH0287469.1 hypothetical protein SRABI96_04160 [Peribacillus sp. Bi96]